MKKYIAYFDYLGYKSFILNNSNDHLRDRIGHLLRDFEMAIGQGKFVERNPGLAVSDLSNARINCHNYSDTVIFTTLDDSSSSLEELLLVAKRFNWQEMFFNMPAKGIMYYGELETIIGSQRNELEAVYSVSMLYGKGLVNAHLKCENLSWAGCVIDQTVLDRMHELGIDIHSFLQPHAKLYMVPYKNRPAGLEEEYALNIIEGGLNEKGFQNYSDNIRERFAADGKPVDSERVQEILNNTITYLKTFMQ